MPDITIPGISLVWRMIVGLIGGYESQKKGLFEAHVEPLHQRMMAIHKDYIDGFEEVKRYLDNRKTPPSTVIEFLEQRRRDYLCERELVEKIAEALQRAERRCVRDEVWSFLRTYCQDIIAYFYATSEVGGISWYTDFIGIVKSRMKANMPDVWDTSMSITDGGRADLLNTVQKILDSRLPDAFSRINTYYAILRTRLL